MFGGGSSTTTSTFGSTNATSSATTNTNLFSQGSQSSSAKPAFGSGSNLFGQSNTNSSDTNKETPKLTFGSATTDASKKPEEKKEESKPLFGSGSGGSLFGSKPASSDASKPLFGSTPSSGSLFGGASKTGDNNSNTSKPLFGSTPSTGGNLFGSTNTSSEKKDDSKSLFSSGGFGAKTDSSAGNLFGGADKKDDKPAGNIFGAKTDDKPAGSLFGGTANKDDKPAGNLFGAKKDDKPAGSLFGTKINDKPAGNLFGSAAKTEDKPAGSLFGSSDKKSDDKPADNLFGSAATSTSTGGNLFGAKTEEKTESKDKPSDLSKPDATNKVDPKEAANLAAKKTSKLTVPTEQEVASYLQNRSLEDIIAKWTNALTKRSAEFQSQAADIAAWDKVLAENGDRISQMYTDVILAERKQSSIDQTLDYITRQQDDVDALLERYEAQANEFLADLAGPDGLQPVDQEREKAYRLAEELDGKIGAMSNNLETVINEINEVSTDLTDGRAAHDRKGANKGGPDSGNSGSSVSILGGSSDDPITQIIKILNAHLSSLQWIDTNTTELQEKLDQIEQLKNQGSRMLKN